MSGTFIHGDCRSLIETLDDESIDLVLTDPPYVGVVKETWDQREVFNIQLIHELYRVMKPSASIYVWCGIGEKSQSLMRWWPMLDEYFHFKDLITWKKRRGIGMRKGWLYTREEIVWFVKNNKKFIWNKEHQYSEEPNMFKKGFSGHKCKSDFKRITNVWTDVPEKLRRSEKNSSHATPKPGKALSRIIQCHTKPGDLVFDPFAGSGSTLSAAKSLGRRYLGIEIDHDIYSESARRLLHE